MTSSHEFKTVQWHKSSYSGQGGDCVEVADLAIGIAVRDSKAPDGPVIRFGARAWDTFVTQDRYGRRRR